jgi:hypothetical protein
MKDAFRLSAIVANHHLGQMIFLHQCVLSNMMLDYCAVLFRIFHKIIFL